MSTLDDKITDNGCLVAANNLEVAVFNLMPNVTGASEMVDCHQGGVERKYARREANTYFPRDVRIPPFGLHLLFSARRHVMIVRVLRYLPVLLSGNFLTRTFGVSPRSEPPTALNLERAKPRIDFGRF